MTEPTHGLGKKTKRSRAGHRRRRVRHDRVRRPCVNLAPISPLLHRQLLPQNHQLDRPIADAGVQIVHQLPGRVGDEMDDGGYGIVAVHAIAEDFERAGGRGADVEGAVHGALFGGGEVFGEVEDEGHDGAPDKVLIC